MRLLQIFPAIKPWQKRVNTAELYQDGDSYRLYLLNPDKTVADHGLYSVTPYHFQDACERAILWTE